jgi:hypothetical protein
MRPPRRVEPVDDRVFQFAEAFQRKPVDRA